MSWWQVDSAGIIVHINSPQRREDLDPKTQEAIDGIIDATQELLSELTSLRSSKRTQSQPKRRLR